MMMISIRGAQTLAQLTRLSSFTHPLVLKNIDSLEANGYIERRPHMEDRRIKMLYMTAAGEKLIPEIKQRLSDVNRLARRGLSETEVEDLIVTLQRVFLNSETDDEELVKYASASIAGRKQCQDNRNK